MGTQKLIDAVRRLKVETGSLACLGCGHENSCSTRGCAILREVVDMLESRPTIDAVPVVRCRECVGRPFWQKNDNEVPVCLLSGLYVRSEDDFCPYGERKDDAK